jgi:flagellar hook assembly protein FlgD
VVKELSRDVEYGTYNMFKDFTVENPVFSPDDGGTVRLNIEGMIVEWDGKNEQEKSVENGVYYIHVECKDEYGFVHSVTKDVTVLTNSVKMQVRIYSSAGEIVKIIPVDMTYTATDDIIKIVPEPPQAFVPGDNNQVNYVQIIYNGQTILWDGTNDFGTIVGNGVYTVQIVNVNTKGYKIVAASNLTVLHNGYEILSNIRIIPNPIDLAQYRILTIRYDAMAGTRIKAKLYNIAGELIKTLEPAAGALEIRWNIMEFDKPLPAGVYVVVIEARSNNGMTKNAVEKFTMIR